MKNIAIAIVLGISALFGSLSALAEERPMGFFVTSVGLGKGGDLGGLEGADAHCQKLATAVGAGNREWRAYLSTEAPDKRGVFARARIGNGPWYNARGGPHRYQSDRLAPLQQDHHTGDSTRRSRRAHQRPL